MLVVNMGKYLLKKGKVYKNNECLDPLPHMPILGSSYSAANKDLCCEKY